MDEIPNDAAGVRMKVNVGERKLLALLPLR
jgi:hypothetical protein